MILWFNKISKYWVWIEESVNEKYLPNLSFKACFYKDDVYIFFIEILIIRHKNYHFGCFCVIIGMIF